MNQQKKPRSSNFELLRITAMLMIISYHIFFHCISAQMTYPESPFTVPGRRIAIYVRNFRAFIVPSNKFSSFNLRDTANSFTATVLTNFSPLGNPMRI